MCEVEERKLAQCLCDAFRDHDLSRMLMAAYWSRTVVQLDACRQLPRLPESSGALRSQQAHHCCHRALASRCIAAAVQSLAPEVRNTEFELRASESSATPSQPGPSVETSGQVIATFRWPAALQAETVTVLGKYNTQCTLQQIACM